MSDLSPTEVWKQRQAAIDRLLTALDGDGSPKGEFTESAAPLARELRPAVLSLAAMERPKRCKAIDPAEIFDRILVALNAALDGDRLVRTGDRAPYGEATAPVAREIRFLLEDLATLPERKGLTASERLAQRIAAANSAA